MSATTVGTTPAPIHGSVRRVDILFTVAKFAALEDAKAVISGSKPLASLDTSAAATNLTDFLFQDYRMTRVSPSKLVYGQILCQSLTMLASVSVQGHCINSFDVSTTGLYGFAVNASETVAVVTAWSGNSAHFIDLYSLPEGELLRTIGKPDQFRHPSRLCFTPQGTLLVTDYGHSCVHEITLEGESKRVFRDIAYARSICCNDDVIVAGTNSHVVVVLDMVSGGVKKRIDGFVDTIESVCLTLDGHNVLSSLWGIQQIWVTSLATGVLLRKICQGFDPGATYKDIVVCDSGEIVVADGESEHICVYDSDERTVLRHWKGTGRSDGEFRTPVALSLVNGRLYVLNRGNGRVDVFE